MTRLILSLGFSVLLGSFVFYGESLNQTSNAVSSASYTAESKNKYQLCYEEICGKPAEDFVRETGDVDLISPTLEIELQSFLRKSQKNEFKIQELIKSRLSDVVSGKLKGEVDFGLVQPYDIFFYFQALVESFDGEGSFADYLKAKSKSKKIKAFDFRPEMQSWFKKGFLFKEMVAAQRLWDRSDIEELSKEIYPKVPDFRERLENLSRSVVQFDKEADWLMGLDFKNRAWSAKMFLETGLFYEQHFMEDFKTVGYGRMFLEAAKRKTDLNTIKSKFEEFSMRPGYDLLANKEKFDDAAPIAESFCRASIEDELYWASSDLRNRAIEKHFAKLKQVTKKMFEFPGHAEVKKVFNSRVDRLELLKSRSLQETKTFYPFYFKHYVKMQEKVVSLLEKGSFRSIVLYLNLYFETLPDFHPNGESKEDIAHEEYTYVGGTSFLNNACKSYFDVQSLKGSYFTPYGNHMYLEMKSLRFFNDGIVSLGHEIGHGVSEIFRNDKVYNFLDKFKSDVWSNRSCINQYYYSSNPKLKSTFNTEKLQTEEDWADYFAVELVKELKKDPAYTWAREKFECEFVTPDELEERGGQTLKPQEYGGEVDEHSANLFRLMAQELYSKQKLGPNCRALAEEETNLLRQCVK